MTPLADSHGRRIGYARISVTDRCNLRCFYCMPPAGADFKPADHLLTIDELHRLCALLARMGVTKLRITGGEPLVRRDIVEIVRHLSSIPGIESVGITTNGILLADKFRDLRAAGLTGLNVSLDTLRRDRFEAIACRPGLDAVIEGIRMAIGGKFSPLKINVVVIRDVNSDELIDFVDRFRSMPVTLRFIEYMPFRQNRWRAEGFVSYAEMRERIARHAALTPIPDGNPSAISKNYSLEGSPLRIGFIPSVTEDFCDGCNRVRILADGSVKSCLFYAPEGNLRALLREGATDDAIAERIRESILLKPLRHPDAGQLAARSGQSMIEIGG